MTGKVTAPGLRRRKPGGPKIVSVTAYDYTSALIADEAGVDFVLVGDSLGNVIQGQGTTLPVTLQDICYHVRCVRAGLSKALLVADMPFGSYNSSTAQAVDSAVALMQAGAEAVKLENDYLDEIAAIHKAGIPVMGHVGMTPQSVHVFGGFKVQGREDAAAERIAEIALQVEQAGAFSIVLELMPAALAQQITDKVSVPTIGIGAGAGCDGQIQVWQDILGLSPHVFRHSRPYASGRQDFIDGLRRYAEDVREGSFPDAETSF